MTGAPGDPWGAAAPAVPQGDLIEGGAREFWWERRWSALSRGTRLGVLALVVLLALGTGGVWLRDRAADRALALRVDLAASLGVWSSSSAPGGGSVSYYLALRNDGPLPVRVLSVEGAVSGLRLRMPDGADGLVAGRDRAVIPLSVRLTCPRFREGGQLSAEIVVRRADGEPVTRSVRPASADLLLDVARSLCSVRPTLRDREISGPVLVGVSGPAPGDVPRLADLRGQESDNERTPANRSAVAAVTRA